MFRAGIRRSECGQEPTVPFMHSYSTQKGLDKHLTYRIQKWKSFVVVVVTKERALTNKQNAEKLQRTEKEE